MAIPDTSTAALISKLVAERNELEEERDLLSATIDRAPEPLRRLAEYLVSIVGDDEWVEAERFLNGAVFALSAATARAEKAERERDEWCDKWRAGRLATNLHRALESGPGDQIWKRVHADLAYYDDAIMADLEDKP